MEAGAAQTTETDQGQQAQETPQSPSPEPTTTAPSITPEGGPDLGEQIADLTSRLVKVEGAGGTEPDLLAALAASDQGGAADDLTDADVQALVELGVDPQLLGLDPAPAGYGQEHQADPRVDQLQAQIEQLTERETARELKAIEVEYPDITEPEVLTPLKQRLTVLAQQYGDAVATDPQMVRTVYKAIKAEQADAAGSEAEQAATQGASLETNAGRSQQGGTDPAEELADKLLSVGGGSAFTR